MWSLLVCGWSVPLFSLEHTKQFVNFSYLNCHTTSIEVQFLSRCEGKGRGQGQKRTGKRPNCLVKSQIVGVAFLASHWNRVSPLSILILKFGAWVFVAAKCLYLLLYSLHSLLISLIQTVGNLQNIFLITKRFSFWASDFWENCIFEDKLSDKRIFLLVGTSSQTSRLSE